MKGTPSEKVRINLVKNFSTALAFPTAIVWDSKGVPPDELMMLGCLQAHRAKISSACRLVLESHGQ